MGRGKEVVAGALNPAGAGEGAVVEVAASKRVAAAVVSTTVAVVHLR